MTSPMTKSMTDLKKLRMEKKLTQKDAAAAAGVSLRSYITYESDFEKEGTPKYRYLLQELEKVNVLDEEHGILSVAAIAEGCRKVFEQYPVDYCYLFGSYAKGGARADSDVDLLISTSVGGIRFYELTETLRECLHKKVDLLDRKQLTGNEELIDTVLKEGIKIYG